VMIRATKDESSNKQTEEPWKGPPEKEQQRSSSGAEVGAGAFAGADVVEAVVEVAGWSTHRNFSQEVTLL
jgi:hypothetical protein